jgi:hypothetical protein
VVPRGQPLYVPRGGEGATRRGDRELDGRGGGGGLPGPGGGTTPRPRVEQGLAHGCARVPGAPARCTWPLAGEAPEAPPSSPPSLPWSARQGRHGPLRRWTACEPPWRGARLCWTPSVLPALPLMVVGEVELARRRTGRPPLRSPRTSLRRRRVQRQCGARSAAEDEGRGRGVETGRLGAPCAGGAGPRSWRSSRQRQEVEGRCSSCGPATRQPWRALLSFRLGARRWSGSSCVRRSRCRARATSDEGGAEVRRIRRKREAFFYVGLQEPATAPFPSFVSCSVFLKSPPRVV